MFDALQVNLSAYTETWEQCCLSQVRAAAAILSRSHSELARNLRTCNAEDVAQGITEFDPAIQRCRDTLEVLQAAQARLMLAHFFPESHSLSGAPRRRQD
jgi:hypothetical protein